MQSSVDIAGLLVQYFRGSAEERSVITATHPSVFTEGVVEELDNAFALLMEAHHQAREACRVIDDITDEHELPRALRMTPKELNELDVKEEVMIKRFAEKVAVYLSLGDVPNCGDCDEVLPQQTSTATAPPWHKEASLVLNVLSFLSLKFILRVAEDVCRDWREWLFCPEVSKDFWHTSVLREYQECIDLLSLSAGEGICNGDWRTLAMVCCADDDDDESCDETV
ncbi:unnamed protein product [Trypanosoma congolense IL3000]|uniref:F-box domain-containing protein n=1 Tax=Trypanosoma congolense (strain IL3000) TaxID=1068625 RepID=F9W5F1_TRYCI|nr:conserved hypothetical protein [Trypanosoma congolense IL3000]CCD12403.1 unnamed protein product [Trypanosoma congolense IL3000]